ncbi:MAG TPA: hypothetical protein VM580_06885 [Labilithrix sp.]|nr:hypothetical protein [Labilithrix sp.]
MRPQLSAIAIGFCVLLWTGCALVHRLGDYSISDDPISPPISEIQSEASGDGGQTAHCQTNRDCADGSICVESSGACVTLATPECPRIVGDPATDKGIVIGALLGDGRGPLDDALEAAAFLAVEEIDSSHGAGGIPGADGARRPLVVVACDASGDVLRASRHLVEELRVPVIVGPTRGEDVIEITQRVSAKGGTLIMTPTSTVSEITKLADNALTWRSIPSDDQRAKLVIEQINELETLLRATRGLETVKLGIVHATDARGASAYEAIRGKLIVNGRFINDAANEANVSVDAYESGHVTALSGVAMRYATTFRPEIVFITALEQIENFVRPLEQALAAARVVQLPYYVLTDASKTDELLAAIRTSVLPADIRRRIRGVGTKPDTSSEPIFAEYSIAFASRYGSLPPTSVATAAAASYDAFYAVAFAIAANGDRPLSGASVAEGLRALGVGEMAAVGATKARVVTQQLASGTSVSLRGTFGPMQWDSSGDISAGTVEVWCVGTKDGAPSFGSSGLMMDVRTQVIGGAFVQCQ